MACRVFLRAACSELRAEGTPGALEEACDRALSHAGGEHILVGQCGFVWASVSYGLINRGEPRHTMERSRFDGLKRT